MRRSFDTHGDKKAGYKLRDFLKSLKGRYVSVFVNNICYYLLSLIIIYYY